MLLLLETKRTVKKQRIRIKKKRENLGLRTSVTRKENLHTLISVSTYWMMNNRWMISKINNDLFQSYYCLIFSIRHIFQVATYMEKICLMPSLANLSLKRGSLKIADCQDSKAYTFYQLVSKVSKVKLKLCTKSSYYQYIVWLVRKQDNHTN